MHFRLYVGRTGAAEAQVHVDEVCRLLGEQCEVEVVDAIAEPERAEQDNVLATPTLIRLDPLPTKRILGGLSEAQRVADYMKPTDT